MIFQFAFLAFQTVTCYGRPRLFFLGFLLYYTFFLGFVDNEILVNGSDIGLFYQSLLMAVYVVFKRRELGAMPTILKRLMGLLLLLYTYAVINPVLVSDSSFVSAVTASKEFSVYIILPYLICTRISYTLIEKAVTYVGVYLLLVLLFYSFSGWCPEYYVKQPAGIEIKYPTLISLFLFIRAGQSTTPNRRIVFMALLFIWTFGMLSEGHKSILVLTTLLTLVVVFASSLRIMLKSFRAVVFSLVGIALLLEVSLGLSNIYGYFTASSELVSRSIYNEPRLEKIAENPWFGLGFIHKNVLTLSDISIYMESLSVIDSGYIDLLGKFGFFGTIVFISFMIYYLIKLGQNNFSLKLFLIQYLILCITWSVFSYGFGILPLALFVYIAYQKNAIQTPVSAAKSRVRFA